MSDRKHIVVLTGAGVSAESGLKTFRDADGLWEGHDVTQVATPEAWNADYELVLRFYNERRRQLGTVEPNAAHKALAEPEAKYKVTVITQNIDDLHERGGSSNVCHLHGELTKARSIADDATLYDIGYDDIKPGATAPDGRQLRPHVVWFGEAVPMIEYAAQLTETADILLIVGTSLQVYPAASLMNYARRGIPKYYVDPKGETPWSSPDIEVIRETATVGVRKLVDQWLREADV